MPKKHVSRHKNIMKAHVPKKHVKCKLINFMTEENIISKLGMKINKVQS